MTRRLATVAIGAALAVVVIAPPAATASPAVTALASGSWWQVQPSGGQIPPPPNVPTKGLWVDSAPNGTAISAVRFTLSGATAPVLHLRVHQQAPGTTATIQACVTTSAWRPATAGPWTARPQAECARGSAPTNLQGNQLTVDLSGLTPGAGATYDVVLEPAPAPAGGAPAQPFDITFEEPVAGDIATSSSTPDLPPPLSAPVDGSAAESPAPSPAVAAPVTPAAPSGPSLSGELQPAVPSGIVSPPSTRPARIPSAGRPLALARPRARLAAVKLPGRLSRRTRYLLIVILLDLAIWMYLRSPLGAVVRPRLTLYDSPDVAAATGPVRQGRPPALR